MTILRAAGVAATLTAQQLRNPVFAKKVEAQNIVASSQQTDFPATNLLNPMTHLRWKSANTNADTDLDFQMFSPFTNYVAFALHNFSDETVTIFATTGGSPPAGMGTVFSGNINSLGAGGGGRPLILEFPIGPYTNIKVRFQSGGPTRTLTAAVMYAGQLVRMPRSVKVDVDKVPINWGRKPDFQSGMSESGQFLGRLLRNEMFEATLEFNNITHLDYVSVESPLEDWHNFFINNVPFFTAWAPFDYFHSVGYCWVTAAPQAFQNMVTQRYSVSYQMRGLA